MNIYNWYKTYFIELYDDCTVNLSTVVDIEIYPSGDFKFFWGTPEKGVISGYQESGREHFLYWFWDSINNRGLNYSWVQINKNDKTSLINLKKLSFIFHIKENNSSTLQLYFVNPTDNNQLLNGTHEIYFNNEDEAFEWIDKHIANYTEQLRFIIDYESPYIAINYEKVTDINNDTIFFGINKEFLIKR